MNCKRCDREIEASRLQSDIAICNNCGYYEVPKTTRKKILKTQFIGSSVVVFVLFIYIFQVSKWDDHAFSVIPLQLKEMVGSASDGEIIELSKICKLRGNTSCMEKVSGKWSERQPENLEAISSYAYALGLNKSNNKSALQYKKYFDLGGLKLTVIYEYAKILGRIGSIDESIRHFELVINAKPETIQITVVKNYVKLLIKNGRLKKAKSVIVNIQRMGMNAKSFMDKELKTINSMIMANN